MLRPYNPGAVSGVEVITASGARQHVFGGKAAAIATPSHRRVIEMACTDEPVVAVRVVGCD